MPKRIVKGGVKAVKWWWSLPHWFKFGKVALIVLVVVSLPLIDGARQWVHYRNIYTTYYDHFYEEYRKTLSVYHSEYYADYYAKFYADYYTSPQYRITREAALPSATAETVAFPNTSPVAELYINEPGLTLIKGFEGLELEPYRDAGGKLTIGYGHLIKPGEFFGRISEERAHALLREDVRVAEAYVKRYVDVQLNENQFAALTSLVYNIGPGNFRRSTLLSLLNKGKGDLAAREFLRWNKVGTKTLPGLVKRRQAEKQLFERPPRANAT